MQIMRLSRLAVLFLFALLATSLNAAPPAKIYWNEKELHWLSYEQGMSKLKNSDKRGILIIYADCCGTCKAYSTFFKEPEVVKALDGLVLMRANIDAEPAVSKKYGEDGDYVPRTFAVNAKGDIIKGAYSRPDKFAYFIPADEPQDLLRFLARVKSAR